MMLRVPSQTAARCAASRQATCRISPGYVAPAGRRSRVQSAADDKAASEPDTRPADSPFGISGSRPKQELSAEEQMVKAGQKYADDDNPWAIKKSSKLKFTDVVPWDEFMQVYDADTCYQRLYRLLVTTLVYRKNIVVTDEQFQELVRVVVPILMKDGFIYGLDGVPREHKAWKIVDRWVEAVVDEDRVKRMRRESVKRAKVGTRSPYERSIKLTPETNVACPANRHRDFNDDYRLPDSINALPDA